MMQFAGRSGIWCIVAWVAIAAGSAGAAPTASGGACSASMLTRAAPRVVDDAVLASRWSASSPQASVSQTTEGVDVVLRPGPQAYPGIGLSAPSGAWDLSAFQQVLAHVTNRGSAAAEVGLRADDADSARSGHWNDGVLRLRPGEARFVVLTFGQSQGKPSPSIDRTHVSRLVLFSHVVSGEVDLRVDAVAALPAHGAAGESAEAVAGGSAAARLRVTDGVLFDPARCPDDAVTALGLAGTRVAFEGPAEGRRLHILPHGAGALLIAPAAGAWDLRDHLQVVATVRNKGTGTARISGRLESQDGDTDWTAPVTVAPGVAAHLVLPFAAASPIELSLSTNADRKSVAPSPVTKFASDATTAVVLRVDGNAEELVLDDLRAVTPPPPSLPQWLGKRPPVPGEWTMTLNENFDGNALDESRWTTTGQNYWDHVSHFSRQNVVVANGMATLVFEKRRGHANDDSRAPETDYTTGFLTTAGKWSQQYGYFEARVKLPHAPGLWPAIWMMPDRPGDKTAPHSTFDGGMEFDFMEYMTRFGPNRYNVALHWDGYADQHKIAGHDAIYMQPDGDGFVVAGMLWEPGHVAFYANGKEVAERHDKRIGSVPANLIVTLVAGGWGDNVLTGQDLPGRLTVDWIRVWKRSRP